MTDCEATQPTRQVLNNALAVVFLPVLFHSSSVSLSLSALTAFQAGSKKQGVPVVQSRGFISPL